MACESALQQYLDALDSADRVLRELRSYARTVGEGAREHPMMLAGGEVNSWRRFAAEAERSAIVQRQALERFLEAAMQHDRPD
jgi:hypothetical protein